MLFRSGGAMGYYQDVSGQSPGPAACMSFGCLMGGTYPNSLAYSQFYNCTISEVIITDVAYMDLVKFNNVQVYLANKWGVTSPWGYPQQSSGGIYVNQGLNGGIAA